MAIQRIIELKLKVGHFHCLLKTLNINIVQNLGYVKNKIIIYKPGMYNLQTRTVTFPDQEKLLEKEDGG